MDLLYGFKGVLPVICVIFAAIAITNDDTLTRVVLGVLAIGMAVGLTWNPVARFLGRKRHPRA